MYSITSGLAPSGIDLYYRLRVCDRTIEGDTRLARSAKCARCSHIGIVVLGAWRPNRCWFLNKSYIKITAIIFSFNNFYVGHRLAGHKIAVLLLKGKVV